MRIAEEGQHGQPVQALVASELSAIVERDRLAQMGRHGLEQSNELARHGIGGLGLESASKGQARAALVGSKHGLAVF